MSGLADELLADLEDHSGGEDQEDQQLVQSDPNVLKRKAADSDDDMSAEDNDDEQPDDPDGKHLEVGALVLEGGIKPAEELDVEDVRRMELGAIEDVNKIAKLEGSKRMTDILKVLSSFILRLDSILTMQYRKSKNFKLTPLLMLKWPFPLILTLNTISSFKLTTYPLTLIMRFLSCTRLTPFLISFKN